MVLGEINGWWVLGDSNPGPLGYEAMQGDFSYFLNLNQISSKSLFMAFAKFLVYIITYQKYANFTKDGD